MERLVATTVERFGRVDVMWGNAGIPEPGFGMTPLAESELVDWNNIFAVNVTGIYLAWKHAAKWMIANGRTGTLLATTSAAAFTAYQDSPCTRRQKRRRMGWYALPRLSSGSSVYGLSGSPRRTACP